MSEIEHYGQALFEPCKPSEPCRNCGHPMTGHWGRGHRPGWYDTACRECECGVWHCAHGGFPA